MAVGAAIDVIIGITPDEEAPIIQRPFVEVLVELHAVFPAEVVAVWKETQTGVELRSRPVPPKIALPTIPLIIQIQVGEAAISFNRVSTREVATLQRKVADCLCRP